MASSRIDPRGELAHYDEGVFPGDFSEYQLLELWKHIAFGILEFRNYFKFSEPCRWLAFMTGSPVTYWITSQMRRDRKDRKTFGNTRIFHETHRKFNDFLLNT